MKYWQHDETGRTTESEERPSERWFEICKPPEQPTPELLEPTQPA